MTPSEAVVAGVRVFAWAGFLGLALKLSIKDARIQKIRHDDLRVGVLLAAGAYALLAFDTFLGLTGRAEVYLTTPFYRDLLFHLAMTGAAALGLWRARIWPAGDAKLFFLLGAIGPLLETVPNFQGGRYFLYALINVFLPACLFVFVQVSVYVWQTRLKHSAGFLRRAGPRQTLRFAREGAVRAEAALSGAVAGRWKALRENPGRALSRAAFWGASFVATSGFSAWARTLMPSGALSSIVSMAALYWVTTLEAAPWLIGAGAVATAAAAGLAPAGSPFLTMLASSAKSLTVFGLCLQFGLASTRGLIEGRLGETLIPFASFALGSIAMMAGMAISQNWRYLPFLTLAVLGCFFGLCWVFVRVWEDEDVPEIPLDKFLPYMLLHRKFLTRVREEDPDFYERHLDDLYADGLTQQQVKAVRGWARRRGIETLQMQLTMSFAFWIFLGYFLSWALGGSVLARLI